MPLTLLTLALLLAGCATPSAAVSPHEASGCLEQVRRRKHSYLTRNGVEIGNDLMAATAGDPAAQKLVARARNEETAGWVFLAAAPVFFVSAIATALAVPGRSAAGSPIPYLIGGEGLSLGMTVSLMWASSFQEQAAVARYNRDAGCR